MQAITAYKANDGTVFITAEECQRYENREAARQKLYDLFEKADLTYRESGRNVMDSDDFIVLILNEKAAIGQGLYEALHTVYGFKI